MYMSLQIATEVTSAIIYIICNYLGNRKFAQYTPPGTFYSEDAYKSIQNGWKVNTCDKVKTVLVIKWLCINFKMVEI